MYEIDIIIKTLFHRLSTYYKILCDDFGIVNSCLNQKHVLSHIIAITFTYTNRSKLKYFNNDLGLFNSLTFGY